MYVSKSRRFDDRLAQMELHHDIKVKNLQNEHTVQMATQMESMPSRALTLQDQDPDGDDGMVESNRKTGHCPGTVSNSPTLCRSK